MIPISRIFKRRGECIFWYLLRVAVMLTPIHTFHPTTACKSDGRRFKARSYVSNLYSSVSSTSSFQPGNLVFITPL
jgi:hypothetical protein